MAIGREWMHVRRNGRGVRNEGEGVKEWEEKRWWYMVIRNCGDAGEPNYQGKAK